MADELTPFATVEDLVARWRPLSDSETTQAEALLEDASQLVLDLCSAAADASEQTKKAIVCAMVKRAMLNAEAAAGVSQMGQTAGPYSQQFSYTNPTGDIYITKSEKQRLGCGRQRAFSIDLLEES